MSQSAFPRNKFVAIAMIVLVVAGIIAVAVVRLGGDDDAEPRSAVTQTTATASPTPEQTTESPTPSPTPTPTPTASPSCEGPTTLFNEEGAEQDSLLPDCGVAPVTAPEQEKKGLSLACGGTYPVILYKTTTSGAKTSICGVDSSGVDFRFVTQPKGGDTVDLKGTYDGQLDAFIAKDGSTTYTVQAYDGTLLVDKDGKKSTQKSSDWISLDNEPDTD
ncbi:hypothetical protein [Aeromicrobium fastidiosum]|uniref:Uncharacterized protein n=1 Tax=Aeromicrobium fastidiosum TaxID=52699 RepID=A0A641AIE6_9ACTN|nr:hypothetical protein [Aeromicrobium fastidiosum]KAA1374637.1 hypothetical protein ESP62_014685 [Aeromicrobium fastidiosum]MBP2390817.1 hypothetical protein [Aeromicrobium fastidiosum]